MDELTNETTNSYEELDGNKLRQQVSDQWMDCVNTLYIGEVCLIAFYIFYSFLVTFGLCFIVKRKQKCHNCCWNRPGFLQPLDFIDDIERRWAYAACFVVITTRVMGLLLEKNVNGISTIDPGEALEYGFIRALRVIKKLFLTLIVCVVFYPFLACINHRRHIAANITGIISVLPWIIFYSNAFSHCSISYKTYGYSHQETLEEVQVLQTERLLALSIFIFLVPICVSFYVLLFAYVLDLVLNSKRKWKCYKLKLQNIQPLDSPKKRKNYFTVTHHLEYVKNLLRKKLTEDDIGRLRVIELKVRNVVKRDRHEKIFGFRYSSRLICTVTICVVLQIWFVTLTCCMIDAVLLVPLSLCNSAKENLEHLSEFVNLGLLCNNLQTARILVIVSVSFAGFTTLVMLANTLISYKRRWHQLLRGDHSWHMYGTTISSPPAILLNGLKFAGFQVAYLIWGWVVLSVFLAGCLMLLTFGIIIPLREGKWNWIINNMIVIWPTLVLGIIILPLIQNLICRFVFLQNIGSTLAIDNRRIYNAASYYFLILNILVGMFSFLKRILIPLVLGILFLSRLDQPFSLPGYETRDPGYAAFVSMLLVDLYHNHPILKVFVDLLNQVRSSNSDVSDLSDLESIRLDEKTRRSKQIRNKWRKTVTLINNPSLAMKALEQRLKDELRSKRQENLFDTCVVIV